ncbi:Ig-like domain-containing protein [Methanobrevibacter sp.]|uniref:Ig-like domain-containing protein n=1 Tax=Methanobrevibacter sp. TaxID=66852 RepID=UPI0025F0859B|nr:Ig-like domain-containing protein [Methanobrevibacter sp.]MBQ2831110.1 Ig-like domain-containing protein [Methanobrevibacter sp.]
MEYKKSMIIIILAIFLVSIASVSAADADDATMASEDTALIEMAQTDAVSVNDDSQAIGQSNDEGIISERNAGTFSELQNNITAISSGTLELGRNYEYDDGFDSSGIKINKTITIDGKGYTIDAKGKSRVFDIKASDVTIKNLIIKNANYNGDGGAVYFGSSGSVTNCNFTKNKATGYGGAVYFDKSGSVLNCNFADNSAEYGGAIDFEKESNINNCNFTNNAASKHGGAIWIYSGTVANCNFTLNKASDSGGAVFFKQKGKVIDCNYVNNIAKFGGAVDFEKESNINNCNFTNNIASIDGGAINMVSGNVSNCNFTNNSAEVGGAVFLWYNTSNVTNCNFANNIVSNRGGAIYFLDPGNVLNCNFIGNTASKYGGAIYSYVDLGVTADTCIFKTDSDTTYQTRILPPTLNVGNFTILYNSGEKLTFDLKTNSGKPVDNGNISISIYYKNNDSWVGNYSCLSGEGWTVDLPVGYYYAIFNTEYAEFKPIKRTITIIIIPKSTFWVLNHTINANDASEVNLTNDYYFDPAYDEEFAKGIVINRPVTINGNGYTIDAKGQARVFNVQADDVTIENLTIENANANDAGGAVYFAKSGRVINCNFTNNAARYGGAVYFNSNGDVTNCNFTNNTASSRGGAIDFEGSGTVSNCNFTNNTASSRGGAIDFEGSGTVSNCNFTNNTASSRGGAIYFSSSGSTHTVENCNFTNNTAGDYWGGAICFYSSGTVENCNFTNNQVSIGGGGAVCFYEDGAVVNCNFTDNKATIGSAIYFNKHSSHTLTISNSTFLNNRANAESLEVTKNENNITITFMGQNNLLNAIYSRDNAEVTFNNVTYWGANGITTISSTKSGSNKEAGQNITIGVVANDKLVINEVKVTDENGTIVLDIIASENYYISVRHDEDSYYTGAETIKTNMKFHVNVTEIKTTNKTVNITAKSNIIKNEIISGKLLFILPNGTEINATYADGGIWWAEHTFDDYGDYQVNASYIGLSNVTVNYATISIVKANSTVNVSDVVLYYGETKNVTVTAEGATGITAKINENNVTVVNNYTIPISGLDVGNYTLAVTTIPDEDHNSATKKVNITVNKAPAEITIASSTGEMSIGAMGHVSAELSPSDAGNLSYASNDTRVVSVSSTGVIKANGAGTALITVSFAGNDNYAAAENKTVTITVNLNDASVSVNNSTLDLFVGDNFAIVATTDPVGLNVTYVPDNSGVVSVENGVVTALKEGNATIMVKVGGDGVYAENSTEVTVTVSRIATNITLGNETIELKAYKSVGDLATLSPAEAGNLTYASSDEEIALVSEDGIIYARTKGTATVTVSFAGNDKYKAAENRTITVNVTLNDASVSVENDTIDLNVGDTCIIDATANPRFLTVYYASSNESVATVTDYGNVKAVGEGTAIITLTVGNGETYAVNSTNVTITVSKIPTEINIDPASLDLFVGDETVIVANLTPAGAGNVTFTSSDYDVVDFDDECNVIAQGKGQAIITVSFAGDNKYAAAENKTITVTVSLNDASVTVDNDTLDLNVGETYAINATKSPDTILLDIAYTSSNNSVATVNENGVVTAVGEGTAIITVEVGDGEIYAINSTNVTVTVSRIPTEIDADPITATYNADKYLVITLKDANGTPISCENITVDVNGVETYRTDENGSVKVSTNGLASGIYDAKITFNGSAKYYNSAKAVNVTIKKATPVINATAKTFKTTDKTKKYMVILKDSNDNPMANATVTLKVNSKTYYAKTDENGQATFRLTKLTRAATYTAAITYRGDDNYSKVFKKVKLTVKTGFKTVSKGSKDKAIVKKIQVALKSNGYYIKSNGHKLKVDGIYDIYTEKAVKQFQKANGLKVTGKVDENTALKLGII